jgi:hypothetical protein
VPGWTPVRPEGVSTTGCNCSGGGAAQRYQLVLPNGASATYASKTEALAAMSALPADTAPGARVITRTP